jgi:hypothetical protein
LENLKKGKVYLAGLIRLLEPDEDVIKTRHLESRNTFPQAVD